MQTPSGETGFPERLTIRRASEEIIRDDLGTQVHRCPTARMMFFARDRALRNSKDVGW